MVRLKTIVVFLLLVGGFSRSWAQGTDYEKSFQNGKELFQLQKYELAMEALKPATRMSSENPWGDYASFYYGLAAYQSGYRNVAKGMFFQIVQRTPDWHNADEVNFWLGRIHFELDEIYQGLEYFGRIKSPRVKEDISGFKIKYLDSLSSFEELRELNGKFPSDKEIAWVYAFRVANTPRLNQDPELLKKLITEFDLNEEDFHILSLESSEKKDSYNVAVLFPFMYEDIASRKYIRSNFILELYQGVQKGMEQLTQEGIKINLFTYDTRRDSATTTSVLSQDGLNYMDLIIGPLYPATIDLVSNFSFRNRINMVNPLSENSKVIGNNPYSFLIQATTETKALKGAELAKNTFYPNKYAVIIYGDSQKDSIMAFTYKEAIEKDSFEVVWMPRILKGNSKLIVDSLTATLEIVEEEEDLDTLIWQIKADSIGHIFVASTDDQIAANTISAVESRPDLIPVIAHSDWLRFKFIQYNQIERLNIYFLASNYIDPSQSKIRQLEREYLGANRVLPSKYYYTGYDVAITLGRFLHGYGNYFQTGFPEMGLFPGELSVGFQYDGANDNQHISVLKLVDSEMESLDPTIRVAYPEEEPEEENEDRDD